MARTIPRTYTFAVAGRGPFPLDMLRYDMCRPKTEIDSHTIERSYAPRSRTQTQHVRLVGPNPPTEGRWASFGWDLESVE